MENNQDQKKIKELIIETTDIGFYKVFPDEIDKEYFYIQKDIEHPLFKGLHIIIDEKIAVYCKEIISTVPVLKYGGDVMIISEELESRKLSEIVDTIQFSWK